MSTTEQLTEPALHRRTFAELSDDERQAFLTDLREKRETLIRKIRQAKQETDRFSHGSSIRRTLDKQYDKIEKQWQKADAAITKLEHLLQELFSL